VKKLAIFLAVLLLLAVPVLAAEPTEALRDVIGTDELTQSLPDEAAEVMNIEEETHEVQLKRL